MSAHGEFTSLHALPPCTDDAPLAAVLLRDLAAGLGGPAGGVHDEAVEVTDDGHFRLRPTRASGSPVDAEHAPLAAPELFDGAAPDARSDVYAAACLALTRYLGASPVPTVAVAGRAPSHVRQGALRQAHRTAAVRLGAMPAPFRGVFAQAMAKAPHLRPTPAALVARLDAAFAAAGPDVEAAARTRAHRLVVLARVFEPTGAALAPLAAVPAHAEPGPLVALHLPARVRPAFARPTGVARAALVAAVTVLATGGVAAAAIAALSGGPATPLADATPTPAPTSSAPVVPVAATSSPPAATGTAPTAADPTGSGSSDGNAGAGGDGSGGDGSGGDGSGGGGGNGYQGGGSGGGSTPTSTSPSAAPTTRGSTPPVSSTPTSTTPTSTPPSSDPPTSTPPSSDPPTSTPPSPTNSDTNTGGTGTDTDSAPAAPSSPSLTPSASAPASTPSPTATA